MFLIAASVLFSSCDEDIGDARRSAARIVEHARYDQGRFQAEFEARAAHKTQVEATTALAQYSSAIDTFLAALEAPFAKKKRTVAALALQEEERKLERAGVKAKYAVLAAHQALDDEMVESARDELRTFVRQRGEMRALDVSFDRSGVLLGPSDENQMPLLRALVKLCEKQGELELAMTVPLPGNAQDELDTLRNARSIARRAAGARAVSLRRVESQESEERRQRAWMAFGESIARETIPSHERAKARLLRLVRELGLENRMRTSLVENDEEEPMTLWVVVRTPCDVP